MYIRLVVKTIAESLSQHDENMLYRHTPHNGVRVGKKKDMSAYTKVSYFDKTHKFDYEYSTFLHNLMWS
jgi:hypothetical protein